MARSSWRPSTRRRPGRASSPAWIPASRAQAVVVRFSSPRRAPPVSIQRVATAAAMPTCLLMHPGERRRRRQIPAAPHQRVEHPHPVRPPGRQGRTVTAERIQRRHFNPRGPLAGLVREPLGQHFSAVSGNDVNELSAVQVDSSGGEHRRLDRAGASERGLIGRRSRWRTRRAGPAGAIEHCARGQRPSPWPTRPPSSRATAATE